MTIFKYPVTSMGTFTIEMPEGARVLSFQAQHGTPVIWAAVSPGAPMHERRFTLIGTGHSLNDPSLWDYIGTTQLDSGLLVVHLFGEKQAA